MSPWVMPRPIDRVAEPERDDYTSVSVEVSNTVSAGSGEVRVNGSKVRALANSLRINHIECGPTLVTLTLVADEINYGKPSEGGAS